MNAVQFLQDQYKNFQIEVPSLHIVLGSGLSSAFEQIKLGRNWEEKGKIVFKDVPGLVSSTAPGHSGVFRYYHHARTGKSVVFQVGRLHGYEGLSPRQVVLPMLASKQAGTQKFLLTNAAGSLKRSFKVGSVMLIKDHVNLSGANPLSGPNPLGFNGEALGPRFPDMTAVYSAKLQRNLKAALKAKHLAVNEGIYLGLSGPAYETPAEVKLYSSWGLGAVGMSTVWEAIALRHAGAEVTGLSFISNMGCGLDKNPLRHEDVEAIGKKIAKPLVEALFDFARERNQIKMKSFDIAIRCGQLMTMKDGLTHTQADQLLGISAEKISHIGPWSTTGWTANKFLDASGSAVMPGLVNAHTHLPMSLFRGLADDLAFADWLNKYILPLEARLVDPEFVRLGAELSALECIQFGTTCVSEMFYFDDHVADVVDRAGLRGLIGETVFDFTAPDNKQKDGNDYKILDRLCEKYAQHERIRPSIAPHAPYTCSDETLQKALAYAQKKNIVMQIHVSETKHEFETSLKDFSKTPVQRLWDLGVLSHASVLAHCVHLTDADITLLAKSKASPVYNPDSNMKLGSGAAPIRKLLQAGVNVAIGTDGPASNNNLNLFQEMDVGTKLQKLVESDNTAMTAAQALHMATVGGAKALGLSDKIGTLEVGKLADCIVVDLQQPHMQPLHNLASQLVYSASGNEVQSVICHGKILMQDRKHLTINPGDLFGRIAEYRARVNL